VDVDTETEAIEDFPAEVRKPVTAKEKGVVLSRVRDIESRNGGEPRIPKLDLNSRNLLASIPPEKQKVRLFL
jgi:hypothetical protein